MNYLKFVFIFPLLIFGLIREEIKTNDIKEIRMAEQDVVEMVLKVNIPTFEKNLVKTGEKLKENDIWEGYSLLKRACSCESAFGHPNNEPRQFENGKLLWSYSGTLDVGACQISLPYWKKKSEELGLDIFTYEGNISMAKYIYNNEGGIKHWSASKYCWGKYEISVQG